jgi:hypothetical protein
MPTVPAEIICQAYLVQRYTALTLAQTLVFGVYAALFIYSILALGDWVEFQWLAFSIGWGSTALVLQVLHCACYLLYKNQVQADGRKGDKPVTLVGTPVLRDIQLGVLVSTFSFMVMLYLVVQFLAFRGTGHIEHAIQVPFLLLLAQVSLATLYYMLSAIVAQIWPVCNMKDLRVSMLNMATPDCPDEKKPQTAQQQVLKMLMTTAKPALQSKTLNTMVARKRGPRRVSNV